MDDCALDEQDDMEYLSRMPSDVFGEMEEGAEEDLEGALEGELGKYLAEPVEPLSRTVSTTFEGELPSLQAIYGNDFQFTTPGRHNMFRVQLILGAERRRDQVWLFFVVPEDYPSVPAIAEIEPNMVLTRVQVDGLYSLLQEKSEQMVGGVMINDLIACATDFLSDPGSTEGTVAIKRLVEKCSLHRLKTLSVTPYVGSIDAVVRAVNDSCKLQCLEVSSARNILRIDLAHRFERKWTQFRKEKDMHRSNAEKGISVCYHGTHHNTIPSIVREGFLVPGGDTGVQVRCGSSFGRGVYSSPNPSYCLSYACGEGDVYLICVAVLMGRPYHWQGAGPKGGCMAGYDSHIAGSEYVIFNEAQMLPCLLLTLRPTTLRSEVFSADTRHTAPALPERGPKSKDCLLKNRAHALKSLPGGFGPAGAHFEVLEVAPYDDDDDDDIDASIRREEHEDAGGPEGKAGIEVKVSRALREDRTVNLHGDRGVDATLSELQRELCPEEAEDDP